MGLRLPHKAQLRELAGKLWPENQGFFPFGGYTRGIGARATDHLPPSSAGVAAAPACCRVISLSFGSLLPT
ncbi:hypothetical protein Q0Z83_049020 [Actinoplanes sichuanensis]|uniref:Uncharacterized protein n=1 Tax=Actinoplanes sichuanensis TaxID=512349 RepID=A0ABW4AP25_9ACTN|nr:hypothetical protein Q0Z83_049020 [Actinoplanes sichuanensis]